MMFHQKITIYLSFVPKIKIKSIIKNIDTKILFMSAEIFLIMSMPCESHILFTHLRPR